MLLFWLQPLTAAYNLQSARTIFQVNVSWFFFQFKREEDAEKAAQAVNNRWFNGMPVYAELSPVTDFREACCRQYEMG